MLCGFILTTPVALAQFSVPSAEPTLGTAGQMTLRQQADGFYKRCISKPDPTLSELDNEEYCVCLSVQMYNKELTADERTYLATGEGAGIPKKRLYAEVYGPCLGIPGRAVVHHKCTHDPKIYKIVKDEVRADLFCGCVNSELAPYWDKEVPAFMKLGTSFRRDFDDPIEYLINGRDFPARYSTAQQKCTPLYGRRD